MAELHPALRAEAQAIAKRCVHCGFCLATCPTFQLLGDERDGPRGRIDLVAAALRGEPVTTESLEHLDRCLSCLACETTCPSGVRYGRLATIGREYLEKERSLWGRLVRRAMGWLMPYPRRFGAALRLGRLVRPILPQALAKMIPLVRHHGPATAQGTMAVGTTPAAAGQPTDEVLLFHGCVQDALVPAINEATTTLLHGAGLAVLDTQPQCCGALPLHLGQAEEARQMARNLLDQLAPDLDKGISCVVNASGCLAHMRDYGALLSLDARYAQRAARAAKLFVEPASVLQGRVQRDPGAPQSIMLHAPCTLQHGLHEAGSVLQLLEDAGFQVAQPAEAHLCCGAAGPYAILERPMAQALKERKLAHLEAGTATMIATANIGCLTHLAEGARLPVRHYLELLQPKP